MKNTVKFLFYLLLLIFPLGQLTGTKIGNSEVKVYGQDFIIVLLILSWLFFKIKTKGKIVFPILTRYIFSFTIAAFFSLVLKLDFFPIREIGIGFLYLLRWIGYSAVYFIVSDLNIGKRLYEWLVWLGLGTAGLGLGQYFLFPDIRPLTNYGWDPHYYRVVGTFLDPGYLGMILVLSLIVLLDKLWREKKEKRREKIFFIIIYIALALTYSRSAYLAYLAVMLVFSIVKKAKKFFIKVVFIGIITLLILPRPAGEGVRLERQSTILARLKNWRQSLQISWKEPLFGVGFNTYRYVQRNFGFIASENWQETHSGAGADSSLLFVLAATGIVGLIAYLNLIIKIIRFGGKNKKLVSVASMIGLLVHSCFNNSLFYPWIMIWSWLVWGEEIKECNE